MAFIDFDNEEDTSLSGNPYLDSPDKALQLIAAVYSGEEKGVHIRRLLKSTLGMLKGPLLDDLFRIPIIDTALYDKVQTICAKIAEQTYFPHLAGKTIIGVGGKFSTGKSCFLNALSGCDNLLPIDQKPTTSIPTYLAFGEKEAAYAYSAFDKSFLVDSEMMYAFTHAFYDKYKIGFAKVIRKLALLHPDFRYKNIALLDTPGYNKADLKSEYVESSFIDAAVINSHDARVAREHLQNCDYLLWLVSAESGIISQTDIDFLKTLSLRRPCLVVLTKADKKTQDSLKDIVRETKLLLEKTDIPIADVTAFSAHDKVEYFDKTCIPDFIKKAAESHNGQENILAQTQALLAKWKEAFAAFQDSTDQSRIACQKMLQETWDPFAITSLVALHREYNAQSTSLIHIANRVQDLEDKIYQNIQNIIKEDVQYLSHS